MNNWEKKYKEWINDFNIDKKDKIILEKMSKKQKKENFYSELNFGTAGIRGIRGLGTNRINKYIIKKITQGYCDFIKKNNNNKLKKIIIAYDTRYMSKEFAKEAAKVFIGNNIQVYIFNRASSTPELSFAVRTLNASGGIVMTASHNTSEYNGYKIYNYNGSQFSNFDTKKLISYIGKIKSLSQIKTNDFNKKNIKYVSKQIEKKYIENIMKLSLNSFNRDLKILYSPLHGVGLIPLKKIFDLVQANYDLIIEQCVQDGDFPTISKPNPEEFKSFNLLLKKGIKKEAELLLANDPDADRLGVMVKHKNKYVYLTGNQIGALLINYILKYKKYNYKKSYIVTSIVTSKFGLEIAKFFGVKTIITFTGFKNIGNKIEKYISSGKKILFAYEESIGYLPGTFIRDKDGISSAYIVSEMTGVLKKQGKTLIDELNFLYKKFGYYKEKQFSYILKGINGVEKIKKIMKDLRKNGLNKNNLFEKNFYLKKEIDYQKIKIDGQNENLLYYKFKDKSNIAIRPSGTEPKLKVYINIIDKTKILANKKCNLLTKILKDRIKNICF